MKEREIRLRLKSDFEYFSRNCLKIRPKEGDICPFILNSAQRIVLTEIERQLKERNYVRIIILKGRQQGVSTFMQGYFFWKVIHSKGMRAFILTHMTSATANLFKLTNRFYQYLPDYVKPWVDRQNSEELSFTRLDSGYAIGTAGGRGTVGRSDTIQLFHGSEVAFWENAKEIASGVMQAIPRESIIALESTANGMGNYFHEQWLAAERGESDYKPIFLSWTLQPEYSDPIPKDFSLSKEETALRELYNLTNGQMIFRRRKISELGEALFKQEYPLNSVEAFQASMVDGLIHTDLVDAARKCKAEKYGPILIGVDPARSENGDRTSIICRQGRVAYDLKSFKTNDTMQIVGILHNMIKESKIDAIFVDVVGLGAGVVDRLREFGYSTIVHAVNAGGKSLDQQKYKNKKAEMWALMLQWLKDTPCQIPDEASLHSDLCAPNYHWDSVTRLVIESKESLKKRGFNSPDEAEALALTFAFPINPIKNVAKSYMNTLRI